MAVGETVRVRAMDYVVLWDGACRVSLLSDYPRPSPLADLVKDQRAKSEPKHRVERVRVWCGRTK